MTSEQNEHVSEGSSDAPSHSEPKASSESNSEAPANESPQNLEQAASPNPDPTTGTPEEPALKTPTIVAPPPSILFLLAVAIVTFGADLLSKYWAATYLLKRPYGEGAIEVIKDRLYFVLRHNPGGAWGILANAPESIRFPFFVVVSVAAFFVLVGMYRKLDRSQHVMAWGVPLVLGGAAGNLIDRLIHSEVVDFIKVNLYKKQNGLWEEWPTFNVADIAICVGVGLMAIDFLFPKQKVVGKPKPQPETVNEKAT